MLMMFRFVFLFILIVLWLQSLYMQVVFLVCFIMQCLMGRLLLLEFLLWWFCVQCVRIEVGVVLFWKMFRCALVSEIFGMMCGCFSCCFIMLQKLGIFGELCQIVLVVLCVYMWLQVILSCERLEVLVMELIDSEGLGLQFQFLTIGQKEFQVWLLFYCCWYILVKCVFFVSSV